MSKSASDFNLDSIIGTVVSARMNPRIQRIDNRLADHEKRLKSLEALVVAAKVTRTVTESKPKAARPKAQRPSPAAKREATRAKAGEAMVACPSCKGDGIWGVKANGEVGKCFACFGTGKVTQSRHDSIVRNAARKAKAS